ncbi:hypothetical protein WCLP8_4900001 [uncultured Gammaproteobacteria bacterium]
MLYVINYYFEGSRVFSQYVDIPSMSI